MRHVSGDGRGCCSPGEGECFPPGGARVRGFVHSWLLLQLAQGPAHGYELLERLGDDEAPDPGFLYRALRALEEEGLVRSTWDTAGAGPARRVYAIADLGLDYLRAWSVHLRRTRDRLNRFLDEYAALTEGKGGERRERAPR